MKSHGDGVKKVGNGFRRIDDVENVNRDGGFVIGVNAADRLQRRYIVSETY